MKPDHLTADDAGDLARGFAFVANAFNGDEDGINAVIDEARQGDRLAQLAGAIGVVLRDGFSTEFAGSSAVDACREAALSYRQQELDLRGTE